MKHELNEEVIRKLYESGRLTAYKVSYKDPLQLKTYTLPLTFNENLAGDSMAEKQRQGFHAVIDEIFVKFDGAFSKGINDGN